MSQPSIKIIGQVSCAVPFHGRTPLAAVVSATTEAIKTVLCPEEKTGVVFMDDIGNNGLGHLNFEVHFADAKSAKTLLKALKKRLPASVCMKVCMRPW